jgi:hypothetical protein
MTTDFDSRICVGLLLQTGPPVQNDHELLPDITLGGYADQETLKISRRVGDSARSATTQRQEAPSGHGSVSIEKRATR